MNVYLSIYFVLKSDYFYCCCYYNWILQFSFYLALTKEILFTTTWINLVSTVLNEISQTQRHKYFMILLISGQS